MVDHKFKDYLLQDCLTIGPIATTEKAAFKFPVPEERLLVPC